MITGIVVALPEELSTLTSKKMTKGCSYFITKKILVIYSGAGPNNAQLATEQLISQGATKLISWGCAAALIESLSPGDLILANEIITTEESNSVKLNISQKWHQRTKELLSSLVNVKIGSLVESKSIVSSSEDKKKIQTATNSVALDMESIAIAKIANQHKLPFIAIRVIADPADMNLPLAVTYALNQQGEVSISKLLYYLAHHPTELPGLIKLGLHFKAATKTLKLIAKHLDAITSYQEDHLRTLTFTFNPTLRI